MGQGRSQPQDFSGREGTDPPPHCVCPSVTLLQVQGKKRGAETPLRNPVVAAPEAGSVAATSTPHRGAPRCGASSPRPAPRLCPRQHPPGRQRQRPWPVLAPLCGRAVAMADAVLGQEEPWRTGHRAQPCSPSWGAVEVLSPSPAAALTLGVAGSFSGGRREAEPPPLGWGHCCSSAHPEPT